MTFAFCRAVMMRGMSTSWAMMPGTAVKSAPDRKAEKGKLDPPITHEEALAFMKANDGVRRVSV